MLLQTLQSCSLFVRNLFQPHEHITTWQILSVPTILNNIIKHCPQQFLFVNKACNILAVKYYYTQLLGNLSGNNNVSGILSGCLLSLSNPHYSSGLAQLLRTPTTQIHYDNHDWSNITLITRLNHLITQGLNPAESSITNVVIRSKLTYGFVTQGGILHRLYIEEDEDDVTDIAEEIRIVEQALLLMPSIRIDLSNARLTSPLLALLSTSGITIKALEPFDLNIDTFGEWTPELWNCANIISDINLYVYDQYSNCFEYAPSQYFANKSLQIIDHNEDNTDLPKSFEMLMIRLGNNKLSRMTLCTNGSNWHITKWASLLTKHYKVLPSTVNIFSVRPNIQQQVMDLSSLLEKSNTRCTIKNQPYWGVSIEITL
jgi:hypothetical protein